MEFDQNWFTVCVSPETQRKTCLGDLKSGDRVNLERAMSANARFGGHFVQGHVDCAVTIQSIQPDPPNSLIFTFKLDDHESHLINYIVHKGYVCLDGISLTVTNVNHADATFSIMMIPFTQEKVTMSSKKVGDRVNLEVFRLNFIF